MHGPNWFAAWQLKLNNNINNNKHAANQHNRNRNNGQEQRPRGRVDAVAVPTQQTPQAPKTKTIDTAVGVGEQGPAGSPSAETAHSTVVEDDATNDGDYDEDGWLRNSSSTGCSRSRPQRRYDLFVPRNRSNSTSRRRQREKSVSASDVIREMAMITGGAGVDDNGAVEYSSGGVDSINDNSSLSQSQQSPTRISRCGSSNSLPDRLGHRGCGSSGGVGVPSLSLPLHHQQQQQQNGSAGTGTNKFLNEKVFLAQLQQKQQALRERQEHEQQRKAAEAAATAAAEAAAAAARIAKHRQEEHARQQPYSSENINAHTEFNASATMTSHAHENEPIDWKSRSYRRDSMSLSSIVSSAGTASTDAARSRLSLPTPVLAGEWGRTGMGALLSRRSKCGGSIQSSPSAVSRSPSPEQRPGIVGNVGTCYGTRISPSHSKNKNNDSNNEDVPFFLGGLKITPPHFLISSQSDSNTATANRSLKVGCCTKCELLQEQLDAAYQDVEYMRDVALYNEQRVHVDRPAVTAPTGTGHPQTAPKASYLADECNATNISIVTSNNAKSLTETSKQLAEITLRHKKQIEQLAKERMRWQQDTHFKIQKFANLSAELNTEAAIRSKEAIALREELKQAKVERDELSERNIRLEAEIETYKEMESEYDKLKRRLAQYEEDGIRRAHEAVAARDNIIDDLASKLQITLEQLAIERAQRQRRQIIFPSTDDRRHQQRPHPQQKAA